MEHSNSHKIHVGNTQKQLTLRDWYKMAIQDWEIFEGLFLQHIPGSYKRNTFSFTHLSLQFLLIPHTVWLHCTHGVALSGVITLCPFLPPFHAYRCIYSSLSSHLPTHTHEMYTCVSTHTNTCTHLLPSRLHLHHLADHMPCPVSPGPPQLAPACPPFHLGYPTK